MRKYIKLMFLLALISNVTFAVTVLRDVTISAGYHSVLFNIGDRYEIDFTTEADQQVEINPPDKAGWWSGSSSPITLGDCPGSPESQLFTYDVASNQLPGDAFIANVDGNIICMSGGGGTGSGGSGYFNYEMRLNGIAKITPPSFHILTGQSIELESFFQEYGTSSDTVAKGRFTVGDSSIIEFINDEGTILTSEEDRTGETILVRGKAPGDTYAQLSLDENEIVTEQSNGKVSNLFLESVEFHNDIDIKNDDGEAYADEDWLDSHPYDGEIEGENEKRQPICYVSDRKITVSAKFKIDAISASDVVDITDLRVRGTGPDGFIIGSSETGTGELTEDEFVVSLGATISEGTTKFPDNKVQFYPNFVILWEVTFNNGDTWIEVGSSDNMLYVIHDNPDVQDVYHTMLHIGCKDNNQTEDDEIVDKIFDKFMTRKLYRVNPLKDENIENELLKYWGAAEPEAIEDHVGLLQNLDGRCGAWVNFFEHVLKIQGVDLTADRLMVITYKGYNPLGLPTTNFNHIRINSQLKGQGDNIPSQNIFNAHAVFQYNNSVYDPSYGKKYMVTPNEMSPYAAWENASLDAFLELDDDNETVLDSEQHTENEEVDSVIYSP